MTIEQTGDNQPAELHDDVLPVDEAVQTEDELREASALVNALVKAVKAFRYYPPEYPLLKTFYQDLLAKLAVFLREYYALALAVDESRFIVHGHTLYETKELKSSVPFLLYRDGIRQVRFTDGLEEREMQSFLDILVQCDQIDHRDDDIVTMLWERDFLHIDYVAVDDFLEDIDIVIPDTIEEYREHQAPAPFTHQIEINLTEQTPDEAQQAQPPANFHALTTDTDIYQLTAEDLELLRQEVTAEIAPTAVYTTAALLCDVCPIEHDPDIFEASVDILRNILEAMLNSNDFTRANTLLKRIHLLLKTEIPDTRRAELLRGLLELASTPERIANVMKLLQGDETGERSSELQEYLSLLLPQVVHSIVPYLPELRHERARTLCSVALAEIVRPTPEQLSRYLDDSRAVLVRSLVQTLAIIGGERVISNLSKAFQHHDVGVRVAVLTALREIPGAGAERLLVRGLADSDMQVRSKGALGLGQRRTQTALAPLLHGVHAKGFRHKHPQEIKAYFEAVGLAGFSDAIDALRDALFHRVWFNRGNIDAVRTHAARSLATLGSKDARAILLEGTESRDPTIKQACIQALKHAK